jgi:hypothetical protein
MAERLGTIFVELDLDFTNFEKGQKRVLQEAMSTSLNIEKNFTVLGQKSDNMYNLMRQRAENAYQGIRHSSDATTADIIRAEQAKNRIMADLNRQQYGQHESLFKKIKDGYFKAAGSIAATIYAAKEIGQFVVAPWVKGFNAVEEYKMSVASMAAMVMTFADRSQGADLSAQWRDSLRYAENLVPVLELIAARTLLSGQETTALANSFARQGVFLDTTNQKQMLAFTQISNALPLLTMGQEIMRQINTEVRQLYTGQNPASSMLLQTLQAIDPKLKEHLKTWKEEGTTLEHIGDLLKGFAPATTMLEQTWMAVKSTTDTFVTQTLRGGMFVVYEAIIGKAMEMNDAIVEHRDEIATGLRRAWLTVGGVVEMTWDLLKPMGPFLEEIWEWVTLIGKGWGYILYAILPPLMERLSKMASVFTEALAPMLDIPKLIGAAITGDWDAARAIASDMGGHFKKAGKNAGEAFSLGLGDEIGRRIRNFDEEYKLGGEGVKPPKGQGSGIRDAYETLGIKTAKDYDFMRARVREAYTAIKNDANSTAADVTSAHQAMTKQLEKIDNEQYASRKRGTAEAAREERAELRTLTAQYKDTYDTAINKAKESADASRASGQYEVTTIEELYKAKNDALDEWKNNQTAAINKEVSDAGERKRKLEELDTEYSKRRQQNDAERTKSSIEAEKKRVETIAELYKIINPYSAQSIQAQLNALDQAYKEKARWAGDNPEALGLLKSAKEQETSDIREAPLKARMQYYESIRVYALDADVVAEQLAQKEYARVYRATENAKAAEKAKYEYLVDYEYKKAATEDDFFAGVKAGRNKDLQDLMTWGKAGISMYEEFAVSSKSTLSNVLFDGIKGDLKSFKDYWDSIWDSMLRKLTDIVAEMVVQWGLSAGASALAEGASWLWDAVDLSDITSYAVGSWKIGQDQLAQVHEGEMIVPKNVADRIRGMVKESTASWSEGGITENTYVRDTIIAATMKALGITALKGAALAATNQIGWGQVVEGVLNPVTIAKALISKGVPAGVQASYGWESTESNWGKFLGSLTGAIAGGGPIGSMVGSVVGSFIGNAIADARDTRDNEGLRDAIEAEKGFWGYLDAQREYANFINRLTEYDFSVKLDEEKELGGGDFGQTGPNSYGISDGIGYTGYRPAVGRSGLGAMQGGRGSGGDSALRGITYIPYDDYRVRAHEGEAVLTKDEAEEWRKGKGGNGGLVIKNLQLFVGNEEFDGRIKVVADGVVVDRNRRGYNPTSRAYR